MLTDIALGARVPVDSIVRARLIGVPNRWGHSYANAFSSQMKKVDVGVVVMILPLPETFSTHCKSSARWKTSKGGLTQKQEQNTYRERALTIHPPCLSTYSDQDQVSFSKLLTQKQFG
ncbi:hypothetical protein CBL_01823 [Carabus blaptoides fortunei]